MCIVHLAQNLKIFEQRRRFHTRQPSLSQWNIVPVQQQKMDRIHNGFIADRESNIQRAETVKM